MQETSEYQLINAVDPNAGFCAYITYALNGIRGAVEQGRIPVVLFDNTLKNHFFEPERGNNMWEYYFEPVAGISSGELDRLGIPPNRVHTYTDREIYRMHHVDTDRISTFWAKDRPAAPLEWMQIKRQLGRKYVQKYIHPREHIVQQADEFYRQHLYGRHAIGVHIRGTDFAYATPTGYDQYRAAIENYLQERGIEDYLIFLATDQSQYLDMMRRDFGDRVLALDCLRSDSEVAPFLMDGGPGPYKMGEEVLLDTLVMARCDYLFKSAAAGGEYAMWFGPHLECTDFALDSQFDSRPFEMLETAHAKLNVGKLPPVLNVLARTRRNILNFVTFIRCRLRRVLHLD